MSIADPPSAGVVPLASGTPGPAIVTAPTSPALAFEKLNFDTDYDNRRGYQEDFLGRQRKVAMPKVHRDGQSQIAALKDGSKVLLYHHFSVMIHAERRIPVLSAGNVDYGDDARLDGNRKSFGADEWIIDDRMEAEFQLPKNFYDRWRKLDYGHLVRREDNCWGSSDQEIEFANADTFHLTNCTPQHEDFNRANLSGIWGRLENHIAKQSKKDADLARLTIFAGPIFSKSDWKLEDSKLGDLLMPTAFWKVIVAPTAKGGLKAYGFELSQKDALDVARPFEDFAVGAFEEQQVTLDAIERKTIVRFNRELKKIDALLEHPGGEESLRVESLEGLWLGS